MSGTNWIMRYHRRKFPDYSPDALNEVLRELASSAGCPVTLTAEFAGIPSDAVLVNFLANKAVVFQVPTQFPSEERRDFFTNRWLCSWYLFAAVKERYGDLAGRCPFWLDDYPSGPGLTFCGNATSHIPIPDSMFLETGGYAAAREEFEKWRKPWGLRDNKIFWRGASTGNRRLPGLSRWQDIPRFRLCLLAKSYGRDDVFDVAVSKLAQIWDDREREEITKSGIIGDIVPQARFMNYRHSIDVDGNTSSWPGLFTKFLMGNTVIKIDSVAGYRQWYYDQLVPWRNFVPLSSSMKELLEVAEWLLSHPTEAEGIAMAGHELAASLTVDRVTEAMAATIAGCISRWPVFEGVPLKAP